MRVPAELNVVQGDESSLLDPHQFGLECLKFLIDPERLVRRLRILLMNLLRRSFFLLLLSFVAIVEFLRHFLRLLLLFLNRTTRFFLLNIVIVVVTVLLNLSDHRLLDHDHGLWFWDDNFLLFLIARLRYCDHWILQPLILGSKRGNKLISLIFFSTRIFEFSTAFQQLLLKFGDILEQRSLVGEPELVEGR